MRPRSTIISSPHATLEGSVKPEEMSVDDVTASQADFAGCVYTYESPSKGTWSTYHNLNSIRGMSLAYTAKHVSITKVDWQTEALDKAVRIGENVGKIYLQWPSKNGKRQQGSTLSGVWLNEQFFLTYTHTFKEAGSDDQGENRPKRETILQHPSMEGAPLFVSSAPGVFGEPDGQGPFDRPVRLWDFDDDDDLAVFRISKPQNPIKAESWTSGTGLDAIITLSTDVDAKRPRIFVIAYCDNNSDLEDQPEFLAKHQSKDPELHARVFSRMTQQSSSYDYMQENCLETLQQSAKGAEIHNNLSFHKLPSFNEIFQPKRRALAVGQLIPLGEDTISVPGAPRYQSGKLAYQLPHTISAFLGCSGGIVATIEAGEDEAPVVKIFGLNKSSVVHILDVC
ncbi:MAG: hypothetical protein Q9181_007276 [Wetmoreana brouardii]